MKYVVLGTILMAVFLLQSTRFWAEDSMGAQNSFISEPFRFSSDIKPKEGS